MQTMMQRLYRTDQYERQVGDFYPTPAWVTLCLLDTVPLRGIVLEPCAGQGAMAKVIADAGHQVIATDLIEHDSCIFPIVPGVDALQAPLPAGVQTILTNPPYRRDLLPRLVERWLEILESCRRQALSVAAIAVGREPERPGADDPTSGLCRPRQAAATDPLVRRHRRGQGRFAAARSLLAGLGLESGSGEAAVRPLVQRSAAEGLPGLRRLARASAGRGEDLLRPLPHETEPEAGGASARCRHLPKCTRKRLPRRPCWLGCGCPCRSRWPAPGEAGQRAWDAANPAEKRGFAYVRDASWCRTGGGSGQVMGSL